MDKSAMNDYFRQSKDVPLGTVGNDRPEVPTYGKQSTGADTDRQRRGQGGKKSQPMQGSADEMSFDTDSNKQRTRKPTYTKLIDDGKIQSY